MSKIQDPRTIPWELVPYSWVDPTNTDVVPSLTLLDAFLQPDILFWYSVNDGEDVQPVYQDG